MKTHSLPPALTPGGRSGETGAPKESVGMMEQSETRTIAKIDNLEVTNPILLYYKILIDKLLTKLLRLNDN